MDKVRVAELFAGVGGFRLGLENASDIFQVVWANQYEPTRSKKFQHAYNVYKANFKDEIISNEDITQVNKEEIPDIDLLVGGFPCQDYSVVPAVSASGGIYGKKGILWWEILSTIKFKKPRFILLENVDRLLKSPGVKSGNPGRDFGIILRTLNEYGYSVQWKMINAADYGAPQKRRRTFIFAFHNSTFYAQDFTDRITDDDANLMLTALSPLNEYLPNEEVYLNNNILGLYNNSNYKSLVDFSNNFVLKGGFGKIGVMRNGMVAYGHYIPKRQPPVALGKLLEKEHVNNTMFLSEEEEQKIKKLRSGYSTIKTSKNLNYKYPYSMGKMAFFDDLNSPARTIVTSERSISRMTHVVKDPLTGKARFLSPEEAEKINTFPKGWTNIPGISDSARFFLMGNALVVELVEKIGKSIARIALAEPDNFGEINFGNQLDIEVNFKYRNGMIRI